ncbi:MAG: alpha/beta fold hydrolase [Chloroflexi bacterium]|nr:alpha/beta fold hydrolase [Chloroflexota bacterium]
MGEATLNYQLAGSGPPLLLVHGFGVSFNIWRELSPHLTEHFRLVMIELPGIGDSPSPDGCSYTAASIAAMESVRQKLAIPKWSVLAYSLGVGVAAAYASAYPQQIGAVVLLCPPLLKGWRWWSLRSLLRLDSRQPATGDWLLSGWRLYWLVALIGFNGRPCRLIGEWVDEIAAQPRSVLKAFLREFPPVQQLLAQAGDHTLLLCGKGDFVSTRPPRRGVNVAFFAGDHSGPVQMAQPVAAQVIDFLAW